MRQGAWGQQTKRCFSTPCSLSANGEQSVVSSISPTSRPERHALPVRSRVRRANSHRGMALVALLALWPALAGAQQPRKAGVVTALRGQAAVARATLTRPSPLAFKDDVYFQDKVTTERDSAVKVLLGGKALVTIRELSDFTIIEGPNKSTVDLGLGRVALQLLRRMMRPGEEIEIRTPNAVAAVRGSFVVVHVAPIRPIQGTGGTVKIGPESHRQRPTSRAAGRKSNAGRRSLTPIPHWPTPNLQSPTTAARGLDGCAPALI